MQAIKKKLGFKPGEEGGLEKENVIFMGVGGPCMTAEGLQSLFPIEELSIMGIFEVLPHILHLRRRLIQMVETVKNQKPDIVITIDSPGFHLPLAKRLQPLRNSGRTSESPSEKSFSLIHYVAPSVWAWKSGRAKKMASLYDHVLTLFSFEPPYFKAHGLKATCVGHPIVETCGQGGQGVKKNFLNAYDLPSDVCVLCVLPGSRRAEIMRLMPIFKETVALLSLKNPHLHVVIPTLGTLQDLVQRQSQGWAVPVTVVTDVAHKQGAFKASRCALAASGTVTLELALHNLPMVVAYRVNRVTAWLARRLIKTPFACLVNIVLGKRAVPELLQNDCRPTRLAELLQYLIEESPARNRQLQDLKEVCQQLSCSESPSAKAAEIVLHYMPSGGTPQGLPMP